MVGCGSDEMVKAVVARAMAEAARPAVGLHLDDFQKALQDSKLDFHTEFPMAW